MDVGLLKLIDTLLKGNIKDKQVIDDIKEVGTTLENNIRVISSFEKYAKELNS
jgi:V-type H+-transporting ATPase subunit H